MENQEQKEVKLTPREEEMQNQLVQAMSQLRNAVNQNKQLADQVEAYVKTDYYTRLDKLWTIVVECSKNSNTNIMPEEFVEYCRQQIQSMLTIQNAESGKKEDVTNEQQSAE